MINRVIAYVNNINNANFFMEVNQRNQVIIIISNKYNYSHISHTFIEII